jgi:hypothetical protein
MRFKQLLMYIMLFSVLIVLSGAFSVTFADSGPNMKDGLWEITVKMEMQGMPMKMPAVTHTQCITRENAVPAGSQPGQECKMIESHVNGDTVTWRMECNTPEGSAKAAGEITYTGDTFKGTVKMKMQGMEMLQRLSGKWIGACNQ